MDQLNQEQTNELRGNIVRVKENYSFENRGEKRIYWWYPNISKRF